MDFPPAFPAWLAGALAAAFVASLLIYGSLLRHVFARGGKVGVSEFGPPDAGLALFFIVWFTTLAIKGFTSDPHPVKSGDLVQGVVLFIVIVVAIAIFLRHRGIAFCQQFGVRRIGFLRATFTAAGLILAALPLVAGAGAVMQKFLGPDAKPQEIVQFFLEAARNSDRSTVVATLLLGAVIAPMAEEFIFRGYIYGVLKRYLGMAAGLLLNAALFAAIHFNVTSLPSLFLLAVCFTVAYEMTGSILVSMCMHAMFNLIMFAGMIHSAQAMQ